MGGKEGIQDAARRWCKPVHRSVAAPVTIQGAHDRAARRRDRGRCKNGYDIACSIGTGARFREGHRPCSRTKIGPRDGVVYETGVPFLRPQLRRAGSKTVLLQLEARLVRELLRHRRGNDRFRCGAKRRGDLVERMVRARSGCLQCLRRPTARPDRAQCALSQPLDRESHGTGCRAVR